MRKSPTRKKVADSKPKVLNGGKSIHTELGSDRDDVEKLASVSTNVLPTKELIPKPELYVAPVEEVIEVVEDHKPISFETPVIEDVIEPIKKVEEFEMGTKQVSEDILDDLENDEPIEDEPTYELIIKETEENISTVLVSPLTKGQASQLSRYWTDILNKDDEERETFEANEEKKVKDSLNRIEMECSELTDTNKINAIKSTVYKAKQYTSTVNFTDKVQKNSGIAMDTRTQFNDIESVHTKGSNEFDIISNKKFKAENAMDDSTNYFTDFLGISTPVDVVLPHSGFTITMKYPSNSQITAFFKFIEGNRGSIGFNDSEVSLDSFESIEINSALINLAKNLIVSSTLDCDNPLEYVLMGDLRIIQLATIQSLYPNGLPITMPCDGILPNGTGKPCLNKVVGRISPNTLIYINQENIPDYTRELLEREDKATISIEEVKISREKLATVTRKYSAMGGEIELYFNQSTIMQYVELGRETNKLVKNAVIKAFGKAEASEHFLNELASSPIRKNTYLSKIITKDAKFEEDKLNIKIMMTILKDATSLENYIEGLYEFESKSAYDVGLAKYTCGCGTIHGDVTGLLPINPLRFLVVGFSIKK